MNHTAPTTLGPGDETRTTMSDQAPLIEAPKKSKLLPAVVGVVVLAVAVGLVYALFLRGDENETVRIGVIDSSDPYWDTYVEAAEDEGIDVEVVNFTSYEQPNPALSNGDIDLNQFQHIVYLADYNVANDDDLQPIGSTATFPMGLYSNQYDDVADIPDGATVAVPNDASNQARALLVLQTAGLIELQDGGTIFSDLNEIDQAASRIEVKALDAALTATSLDDVAAAIVNNDFVEKAGLDFGEAIATDDPEDPKAIPYVNIFAARSDDVDNEDYQKLVEIFQDTKAVTDGLIEVSGDAVLVKTPIEELQKSLDDVEDQTRDQK